MFEIYTIWNHSHISNRDKALNMQKSLYVTPIYQASDMNAFPWTTASMMMLYFLPIVSLLYHLSQH